MKNFKYCSVLKYKSLRHRFFCLLRVLTYALCGVSLFFAQGMTALAEPSSTQLMLESQRAMEIQSNQIANWPAGPVVSAEAAILIEAETGTILYAKNIHNKEYPASTTKILTTLIAIERCSMDEMVTFSHDAVFDTPRDSNNIAIDEGESMTMEQCLNAILIRSANEVAFAVAEHVSGSGWREFADIMNERAKELGCVDSHFVNPNGLPDEDHYTSAYDLAMIGRAFFANEILCNITLTRRLDIPPSDTQPDHILENNAMQIIPGGQYAYDYIVGCKTGYTSAARNCLVSCAERDGMKLICVVLKDESPYQYEDTISLFDYGFSNFEKVNVSQTETKYDIDNTGLFYSGYDIFGSSVPILSLNRDDFIILPGTASFEDLDSVISYDTVGSDQAAVITYSYHGVDIGCVRLDFTTSQTQIFDESPESGQTDEDESEDSGSHVIYVNLIRVLVVAGIAVIILIIAAILKLLFRNYQFSGRNSRIIRRKESRHRRRKGKRPNRFRDYDF